MIMIAQKNKRKKPSQIILFSIALGLLTLVVTSFFVISNWKINQRRAELNEKIESLRKEIQILEEKNAELRAGISQSQSQEYLEEVAREQLGLKKPGEEVVTVKPPEKTEEESTKTKSFWQKILERLNFLRE